MARRNDEANLGHANKKINMNTVLPIDKRNAVLSQMAVLLEKKEHKAENQQDLANYSGGDLAMEKRYWLMN
jgi:glutamate-5-semialdehyde dehydrogenase